MSPTCLRSLAITLKAAAHALEREADDVEERAETRHHYAPLVRLPSAASTAASALIRRIADRGAIERCTRCGAIRTTSKPWLFWTPGGTAWVGRKPPCAQKHAP